ncbi:aldolase catalytic domain-containing protein [Pararcticibacter amylolyticus]|uniref:Pyruvate carboxyltransferase domain-containing protein n=1 Tax=Pararcticibacter amylolyticus TaxID=2173175 RepID=A0A2U2PID6_9SPHI|nr:aldolase catalytic domain-containing protein [Pararcticibacter amylolyticus]PWG81163.1 hypothetical protein DDR33_09055 [Pararcticibacter amylolyticus]
MQILDCTFRDGGYYTQWDFPDDLAKPYFETMERLPVDIVELGYRSRPQKGYYGQYFYSPVLLLRKVRELAPTKTLAVMLNEKDCSLNELDSLLDPCRGLVDMIRIAVAPVRFSNAIALAEIIREKGFKVGINIMYISSLNENSALFDTLSKGDDVADAISLVDSYGGVSPEQLKLIVSLCKGVTSIPLGFHGHNNLELAMANTLTAIDSGCEIIDATITGMGRGAGNLRTELLLTYLAAKNGLETDFDKLGNIVARFEKLKEDYGWGTNLPYMVSGANSLPQKDVMDWVSKRYYSVNSIVRALQNQKRGEKDNLKLPVLQPALCEKVIIVGGGPSVNEHAEAIRLFVEKDPEIVVIHASAKNAAVFKGVNNKQYYCIVGNEGQRLESVFSAAEGIDGICVLPPYPRKMGTFVPSGLIEQSFELEDVSFSTKYADSHTAVALQTAILLKAVEVFLLGYDGYPNQSLSVKEQDLVNENNYLFNEAAKHFSTFAALTATRYEIREQLSLYQYII